jgi:hypothetical protein
MPRPKTIELRHIYGFISELTQMIASETKSEFNAIPVCAVVDWMKQSEQKGFDAIQVTPPKKMGGKASE